ncbi:hypothetical protein JCM17380_37090 [Desulfosporosinus burensis]
MRLKKRLILANAATVIIPLIITVLIALAAFFIFGKLLGSEISFEKYQRISMIKLDLIKEANALSRSPEMIEDERFHKYLQEKLSEIKGECALIKDDQIIYSSKNLSKIDVAKCFGLLLYLAQNPNRVFGREELFERVWGLDALGDSATVTVHIARIREKIESDPSNPQYVETVWGAGYRFRV